MLRCLVVVLSLVLSGPAAQALEAPEDPAAVILTITGDIAATNDGDKAVFDRALLASVGWREIETYSPFLDGRQRFAGVPLAALLEHLGVSAGTLYAMALDGYRVEIPVADAFEQDVLLAMDHNGTPMRIRNRGPLWVIYPMTRSETERSDAEGRMIWQLSVIDVSG